MRKIKKFAAGGRADAMRDRRMADIESDYKKAIARGVSEKEARAKRAQREADARDDYAKRTGADRTQTRAAEKAAEAKLTATRRGVDKDIKPVSVTSEGSKPLATAKVYMPEVKTPDLTPKKAAPAPTKKAAPAPTKKRTAPAPAPAPAKKETPRYGASFGKPGVSTSKKDEAAPRADRMTNYRAEVERRARERRDRRTQSLLTGPLPDVRRMAETETKAQRNAEAQHRIASMGLKPAKFAKGGKIDGCAVRGKTRAKRNK